MYIYHFFLQLRLTRNIRKQEDQKHGRKDCLITKCYGFLINKEQHHVINFNCNLFTLPLLNIVLGLVKPVFPTQQHRWLQIVKTN